jgi:galactonate dehydratase
MDRNNRRSFFKTAAAGVAGMFGLPRLSSAIEDTTSSYRRPKLKITDVKTASLQGFQVRIYTDQSLTGDGEAVDAIGGAPSIVPGFRFSLMNQDPLNVEAIWERIQTSGVFSGAQAGQVVTALTAVEIALWDLTGKALGLPIYQLMGGKTRDRIRVYIDSAVESRDDPNSKPFIATIVEEGWTMAKIDVDDAPDPARFDRVNWTANNAEIDHMVDKVAFMRESLPKNIVLAVDMHALRPADRQALRQRSGAVQAGVAGRAGSTGEHRCHARRAAVDAHTHLLRREHLYALGLPRAVREERGGHYHARRAEVRRLGEGEEDRRPGPHLLRSDPSALPGFADRYDGGMPCDGDGGQLPGSEWHSGHPPARTARWKQYVREGDIIQKGYITVSDRPGIGLTINDEALRKMARPNSPWFTA